MLKVMSAAIVWRPFFKGEGGGEWILITSLKSRGETEKLKKGVDI